MLCSYTVLSRLHCALSCCALSYCALSSQCSLSRTLLSCAVSHPVLSATLCDISLCSISGCPIDKRPCPSYCPVKDSCEQVVGLPCGTCHYIDQKDYEAHGFGIGSSNGIITVLNDLGGSVSSASGRGVQGALVALNYNGVVDNSDKTANTSAFSWNPPPREV